VPVCRLSSKFLLTFNKAGQLQRRAVSGSKTKLLITQQPVNVYFPEDPSELDLLEGFANSVNLSCGL
jgi:hypothetical protein